MTFVRCKAFLLAIGVLSGLRFKYIKIPVNCVKMLANTSSIRCAFALFTKIFIIFKFFDLKGLYFWGVFGAEDEGMLVPFKDDNPKITENTGFQAGSDSTPMAKGLTPCQNCYK